MELNYFVINNKKEITKALSLKYIFIKRVLIYDA